MGSLRTKSVYFFAVRPYTSPCDLLLNYTVSVLVNVFGFDAALVSHVVFDSLGIGVAQLGTHHE